MRPAYAIRVAGRDIAGQIAPLLVALEVEDHLGGEADRLELRLQDQAGTLPLPAPRARIELSLGLGATLWEMGAFLVDEVEAAGAPGELVVTARAADLSAGIRAPRSQAWTGATLGRIAGDVAGRNGLDLRIAPELAAHAYVQVEQASESDLHLVTRLARDLDATAKVAGGALLIAPTGAEAAVSGAPLPRAAVGPADLVSWRWRRSSRQGYGAVRARWGDRREGALLELLEGQGAPVYEIRRAMASEAEARAAAARKGAALARAGEELALAFATFRGDIPAGTPLAVAGLRDGVDGDWTARRVRHRLDAAGLLTELDAAPAGDGGTGGETDD